MTYLLSTTENYRVESEDAAKKLIEQIKHNTLGIVSKYNCAYKERKQKGEVIDSWYKVTITQEFTSEKEPDDNVNVGYTRGTFEDIEIEEDED